MSSIPTADTEFYKSFVSVCYENGLNEKQASTLLDEYIKINLYKNNTHFAESLVNTITKESSVPAAFGNLLKAIGSSAIKNPKVSLPIGLGVAGAALTPKGILPDDYSGGAMAGGAAGGLLGLLASRGKGILPFLGGASKALTRGGTGRFLVKNIAGLAASPNLWKGMSLGALGGVANVGAGKLIDKITGAYPNLPPALSPQVNRNNVNSSVADSGYFNPYDLPNEIMARNSGIQSNSVGSGVNPIDSLKQELVNTENKINELHGNLPLANNPNSYSERLHMQSYIDNLKQQRSNIVSTISNLEMQQANNNRLALSNSLERQNLASTGLNSYQTEFNNLMRRQKIEQGGGVGGALMGLYNRITNLPSRLEAIAPGYRMYDAALNQAQQDQNALR